MSAPFVHTINYLKHKVRTYMYILCDLKHHVTVLLQNLLIREPCLKLCEVVGVLRHAEFFTKIN